MTDDDNDDVVDDGTCHKVDEVTYSTTHVDKMMTKLDGLIAANDPETVARYVNDVAAVTNSPSIQDLVPHDERRAVIITSHCCFSNVIVIIVIRHRHCRHLSFVIVVIRHRHRHCCHRQQRYCHCRYLSFVIAVIVIVIIRHLSSSLSSFVIVVIRYRHCYQ